MRKPSCGFGELGKLDDPLVISFSDGLSEFILETMNSIHIDRMRYIIDSMTIGR